MSPVQRHILPSPVDVTVVPDGGLFIVSELTLLNVPRADDSAPYQLLRRVLDPE